MGGLLAFSEVVDRILERIARVFGWLFLALVATICIDVLTRKAGFRYRAWGPRHFRN